MNIEGLLLLGVLVVVILVAVLVAKQLKAKQQAAEAARPVFEGATLKLWVAEDGLHGEVKRPAAQLTRNDWGNRSSKYTLVNDGTGTFELPALMAPFWVQFHLNVNLKDVDVSATPDRTTGHIDIGGNIQLTTHRGQDGYTRTDRIEVGTVSVEFGKSLECKLDHGTHYGLTLPKREAAALLRWVKHRPRQLVPWKDHQEPSLVNA